MIMAFNLTNLTQAENVVDVASFANEVTGGSLVGLLLVAVYFIFLFRLKGVSFVKRMMVGGFVCFILSIFGWYGGFLGVLYLLGFFALMIFPLLYIIFANE